MDLLFVLFVITVVVLECAVIRLRRENNDLSQKLAKSHELIDTLMKGHKCVVNGNEPERDYDLAAQARAKRPAVLPEEMHGRKRFEVEASVITPALNNDVSNYYPYI